MMDLTCLRRKGANKPSIIRYSSGMQDNKKANPKGGDTLFFDFLRVASQIAGNFRVLTSIRTRSLLHFFASSTPILSPNLSPSLSGQMSRNFLLA